jgi:hypothetical protein
MIIISIFLNFLVIGLFLYSKLLPYKQKLNPQYLKIFTFFDNIFSPIFNFMKKHIKPFQVGNGLFVDMTQIVLLILFLFLLNAF